MAFFDSAEYLLSNIRHSFITCDDTGMCEMVMLNDPVILPPHPVSTHLPSVSSSSFEDFYGSSDFFEAGAHSYDIVPDMALIGSHRRRSNTAQRLDKLKKEKKEQANVKSIHWKEPSVLLSQKELDELFPKKTSIPTALPKKSLLSEQLAKCPELPTNPFNEFAKFNGKVNDGLAVKKLHIFLTMAEETHRSYPMEVHVLSSAKVHDVVGLVCWHYTADGIQPPLKPNPSLYCLRIAEETGEVDDDFPSLDPREPIAKFDFPVLALVEKEEGRSTIVTLYSQEGFSKIQLPSLDVTLGNVLEQTLRHRKEALPESEFKLERSNNPGVPLDLNTSVADAGSLEFRLVSRNGSTANQRHSLSPLTEDWTLQEKSVIEAPLYQSYNVVLVQNLGRGTEVQLGISSEKVELTPLTTHKSPAAKILTRQFKPITYNLDSIAACEMVNKKYSSGKAVFKIVYAKGSSGDFKHHLFEAETYKAAEIVRKLQYILQIHFSTAKKEYHMLQEQKRLRKQFTLPS